jgi:hypothetical protein
MKISRISLSGSLKQWLKQFPTIVRLKRSIFSKIGSIFSKIGSIWEGTKDSIARVRYGRALEIIDKLPLFASGSAGTYKALGEATILAANQTFPFLVHFITSTRTVQFTNIHRDSLPLNEHGNKSAAQLKRLFDAYGSDKATVHNYHLIYGHILTANESITAVLEIGLGSNNEDVMSNMGKGGRPGASLRAFRDFLPNARVYGADVDRRILFEEERIRTFFVDQTDLKSFDALGEAVGRDFDLVIDDGLHSPNANIAVLSFGLSRLKPGGWLVVEDIRHAALPLWEVVVHLLPMGFTAHIVVSAKAIVFAVQRTA